MELPEYKKNFEVRAILNKAWDLINGSKWPIWAATLCLGIASFITQFLMIILFQINPESSTSFHYNFFLIPLINNIAISPFLAGTIMTAVKQTRGEKVSTGSGFSYFHRILPLMATMFFISFFAIIPNYIFHLSIIETISGRNIVWLNVLSEIISVLVYVFTILAIPLVVDKNYSPWSGLSTSIQLIKPYWFKVLVLILFIYALFVTANAPLIIGSMLHPYAHIFGIFVSIALIIWLLPYTFLIQGVLYHTLVDRQKSSAKLEAPPPVLDEA